MCDTKGLTGLYTEYDKRQQFYQCASNNKPLLVSEYVDYGSELQSARMDYGITLTWKDVKVTVEKKQKSSLRCWTAESDCTPLTILNNVWGSAPAGSFLAIMGASGSGKTTLMNSLAKQHTDSKYHVKGDIRLNGHPAVGTKQISGYVEQENLFFGYLTAKEHLMFMAKVRLDRRLRDFERRRRVEELVHELSLTKCQNNLIGDNSSYGKHLLSGGERKRLAFASEILTDPPLLFCDEPTSGLDSFSALTLVSLLKGMAKKGRTVICTIHQPPSEVYTHFDRLLLLAEGSVAFSGVPQDALQFFKSLGYECPSTYSPGDYFIQQLAVVPGHEERSRRQIEDICTKFCLSPQGGKEISQQNAMHAYSDPSLQTEEKLIESLSLQKPDWFVQFYWLTWRSFMQTMRDPSFTKVRFLQKLLIAILLGLSYSGIEINQSGIQNIQGALFIFATENTFPSMFGVLYLFPQELAVYRREHSSGLYGTAVYYLSKITSLIPGFVVDPLLFTTIAYWMIGLRASITAFAFTVAACILIANTASACGCILSTAFENVSISVSLLIPIEYLLMVSSGLIISLRTVPAAVAWTQYISWFMYSNEIMSITQWSGVTNITCEYADMKQCLLSGEEVLHWASFSASDFWWDFGAMIGLYLSFHAIAMTILCVKNFRN